MTKPCGNSHFLVILLVILWTINLVKKLARRIIYFVKCWFDGQIFPLITNSTNHDLADFHSTVDIWNYRLSFFRGNMMNACVTINMNNIYGFKNKFTVFFCICQPPSWFKQGVLKHEGLKHRNKQKIRVNKPKIHIMIPFGQLKLSFSFCFHDILKTMF